MALAWRKSRARNPPALGRMIKSGRVLELFAVIAFPITTTVAAMQDHGTPTPHRQPAVPLDFILAPVFLCSRSHCEKGSPAGYNGTPGLMGIGALAMTVTMLPSHKFDQDICGAKRAADNGPVIITDDGRPVYVLLSHVFYRRLLGPTLREMVAQPGGDDIDFDPPRMSDQMFRADHRS
jgi:hypothetical protein